MTTAKLPAAGPLLFAPLLAVALSVGATAPAMAQEWGFLDAGAAFLGVGISRIGTADLDEHLAERGHPTFGRTGRAFNVGAHMILPGGVTLGAEWHGFDVAAEEHEGHDVGLGGGYGTIGFGYVVELSPRVRIYPRLGLGGGGMGLWMESDSAVGFDEVLEDPQPSVPVRQPVLSTGSAVVDFGVGAELLPGGWGRGLMVGVRLGYVAAPFTSDWQLFDHAANGGPAASLGGPYIRAVFGVARRRR